jgi:hypothetical protein
MLNSLDYKPSIIAITEVNSKIYSNNKQVSEFNIAGYTIFSANIGSQDHRGIILYIHESVCACQVDIVTPFSECLFVQIKQLNRLVLTLGVTYRSPSSLSVNNMHLFDLFNTLTSNIHGRIIIVGDFNFRHIDWINCCMEGDSSPNIPAARFLDCLRKNNLIQHVFSPTRGRGTQTPSILDLVITNGDFVESVHHLSPLGKSDHAVLYIKCKLSIINQINVSKLNYSKGNYKDLCTDMSNELCLADKWSTCTDVPEMWSRFKDLLKHGIKKYIPVIKSSTWRRKETWHHPLDQNCRELISRKHRLWTRYQETRDITIFNEFKNVRNLVRQETR